MATTLPPSFLSKKKRILSQLSIPEAEYDDLSPKGSVDEGIRELIDEINKIEGCVTTSSCAGRISVFLEGKRKGDDDGLDGEGEVEVEGRENLKGAGVGGKGGGGRWLFVSHDPIVVEDVRGNLIRMFGMQGGEGKMMSDVMERRLIHFKFEPMILHVLTASLQQAQKVLSAALQAGFRESGALNIIPSSVEPATPMVGIRTMGLALESVIGFDNDGAEICMIPEWQLQNLVEISNRRFVENTKRINRFQVLLKEMMGGAAIKKQGENGDWEDAQARKERKRAEGLERAKALKNDVLLPTYHKTSEVPDLGFLEQNL